MPVTRPYLLRVTRTHRAGVRQTMTQIGTLIGFIVVLFYGVVR
ncbi:MAG TPA: hypothetical protein VEI97_14845 [bacterium]|nr:hypothetical protein [bacterium]